jgi:hypothetical protein
MPDSGRQSIFTTTRGDEANLAKARHIRERRFAMPWFG